MESGKERREAKRDVVVELRRGVSVYSQIPEHMSLTFHPIPRSTKDPMMKGEMKLVTRSMHSQCSCMSCELRSTHAPTPKAAYMTLMSTVLSY